MGVEAVAQEAIRIAGGQPTYLSFDIDSSTRASRLGQDSRDGGLTSVESLALLRALRGIPLMGADVVEVAPPFDPTGGTSLVAATIMYELLCLLARQSPPARHWLPRTAQARCSQPQRGDAVHQGLRGAWNQMVPKRHPKMARFVSEQSPWRIRNFGLGSLEAFRIEFCHVRFSPPASCLSTTMIYTHVCNRPGLNIRSPLDQPEPSSTPC